jgi:RND family efflux transporter MFP subunit
MNNALKLLLPLIIIMASVAIFAFLMLTRPEPAVSEKPEKKWLVNVVEADYETRAPEVQLYGRVESPSDAILKSALEADVAEVHVLEGDVVQQGQLLLKLDDADALLLVQQRQADVANIEAQLTSEQQRFQRDRSLIEHQQTLVALADKALERAKTLQQSKLTSQANLDDAKSTKEQQLLSLKQLQYDIDEHPVRQAQLMAQKRRAEALLGQAELDLKRTEIRSPYDGRVAALSVALGDRVRQGDALVSVYDLSHLEVRAQIPGRYLSEVKTLMRDQKTLTAQAEVYGQMVTLMLSRLSGEVSTDSGGIDGLFTFSDRQDALPLGTFMSLRLRLAAQTHVIKVPFSALYGLDHLYKVADGYMKSVPIQRVGELNSNGENWLLIRSDDIQQGDQIITTQLPNAITGLPVEVASGS